MKVNVTLKSRAEEFIKVEKANIENASYGAGALILSRARMLAPELTGNLKRGGRVEQKGDTTSVVFGGYDVPYAKIRHHQNKKNPQTLHYLQRAGDSVVDDGGITRWMK